MYHDFLLLGGAGLVGAQVARHLVLSMAPRRIVIASLVRAEAEEACEALRAEFGERVSFVPAWGNLFVPSALSDLTRGDLLASPANRRKLMDALYGDFHAAYRDNHLVGLIRGHRPEVIVDAVNTATGLSYQDVFDGAARVRGWLDGGGLPTEGVADLEALLLSQSVPQLVRHMRFVAQATTEYGTRVYLKVGTTGTGGMGLNIPYTHSEDRPSAVLLAKNEAAFGHTGLLFLLARTPGAPVVKEVKPAAMIGYRAVQVREVKDRHGSSTLYTPSLQDLGSATTLDTRQDAGAYEACGTLRLPVVDTGENGLFTRGEFAAITALGQMEYITPEEIARTVVQEIRGINTGHDVISAMDSAVLNPTYKAGLMRGVALQDLRDAEAEGLATGDAVPSIALGRLGPPELSKLLFEAELLRHVYGSMQAIVEDDRSSVDVAAQLQGALDTLAYRHVPPSIGIPILLADGRTLVRGPRINVPELKGHAREVRVTPADVDAWARKGWVDLRPANVELWRGRVGTMLRSRADLRTAGSAAASLHSYMSDRFEVGEVVAWIFNNELGGFRIK